MVRGLLRLYRTGPDGTEQILRFAAENWWMCDLESFYQGLPAKGNIEAVEESDALRWSKEDWELLKSEIPAFNALQLSLDYTKPLAWHFTFVRQLRFLRERGVLLIGSGNIVHNTRLSVPKPRAGDTSPFSGPPNLTSG